MLTPPLKVKSMHLCLPKAIRALSDRQPMCLGRCNLNSGIIGEKGWAELHFLQFLRAYAFKILGITITLDSFTGRCLSVSFKESRDSLPAIFGHAGDDV